ncbi:xanthine dehydrogenase family protein molybdopterin-binding subunit [Thermodesulfobacteriota bacterium]
MTEFSVVGKSVPRNDALEKVTGKARYSVDINLPGMLHAKVLRSVYPHARITGINTSKAERLPRVRAVVTGKDAPKLGVGLIKDRSIIARDTVRFAGEAVAAVAAESIEAAEEALDLIEVEYEELPTVFDVEEAMKADPPVVLHPGLLEYPRVPLPYPLYRFESNMPNVYLSRPIRRGDVEKGFQEADLIMENRFSTPFVQHAALEPHNAVARPEPDGGLTVWDSTMVIYPHKGDLCLLFGLPPSKVRVISHYIGGSFGGKSGSIVPAIAALLALKSGRPVKLVLGRDEIFVDGTLREEMVIYIKDGVKTDGTLVAREMKLILNAGAYSGSTTLVAKNATFGAVGAYRTPNLKLDSYCVATNTPPTGPFRGFGCTEVLWAIESHMDMIAEGLGMDPVEFRKKNLLNEGEENACGMVTHAIGARECLDKISEWVEWDKKPPVEEGPWKRGKGIALATKYTLPGSRSVVNVKVHQDATLEVRYSTHELGQGSTTVLAQIAAEEFCTSIDKVSMVFTDTAITPFDHSTVSSRSTFHAGNALRLACQDAKRQIFEMASERLGVPADLLDIREWTVYVKGEDRSMKVAELFAPLGFVLKGGEIIGSGTFNGPMESEDAETGQGKRVVTYFTYGAQAVELMVNVETGQVRIIRAGASFDMGQPINPKLCEGQMEGGLGMGIGGALYEEVVLEKGAVLNPNFQDYRLPSSLDLPTRGEVTSMIAAIPHREGPFGAKGFGEAVLVSVAPAIANAVYNATGVRIKDLPITRGKMINGLR